jgi:hypothetical protein
MSHAVLEQAELRRSPADHGVRHSPTHDAVQMLFESADMISSFWQPTLKSIGRWQLELAGLGMKSGQASLQLSRDLARSFSPVDVYAAYVRYWDAISIQCAQSQQRIAANAVRASADPAVFAGVVPLPIATQAPVKRTHDVIEIPDDEADGRRSYARKVA